MKRTDHCEVRDTAYMFQRCGWAPSAFPLLLPLIGRGAQRTEMSRCKNTLSKVHVLQLNLAP
jgi:hypothetical protein